jgi:hypothetical protein
MVLFLAGDFPYWLSPLLDPPTSTHAKNDPLRQLMRGKPLRVRFSKTRGKLRTFRVSYAIYTTLEKMSPKI